jgi:stearoyl-CoA desaturase (delta-9 desaturase)
MTNSAWVFGLPGIIRGGRSALLKRVENTVLIGVPLAGSAAAVYWSILYDISWMEVSSFLGSYLIVGLGVSLGLHRYFSHRSFQPKRWIVLFLAASGSMALQGSILRWVADHRRHHAHTDVFGDPHSPHPVVTGGTEEGRLRRFFHAHFGWMFDDTVTDYAVYARDLLQNPMIMTFHRTRWLWASASLLLPCIYGFLLGGASHAWGCFLIGGCLRTTILHNVVWAVNSVGHTSGYQNFPDANRSTNNFLLALLTFGDGWHNNHHRFPRSAWHGLRKGELDVNGHLISGLERIGWAKNVISAPRTTSDLGREYVLEVHSGRPAQ